MKHLPGERVLLTSDSDTLVLTTHRVRHDAQNVGAGGIVSVMLDELASCSMTRTSKPFLLVCAVIVFLLGLVSASYGLRVAFTPSILLALVFVVFYFLSRRQVIALASAGDTIFINTASMSLQTVRDFIDQVEEAKDGRYRISTSL